MIKQLQRNNGKETLCIMCVCLTNLAISWSDYDIVILIYNM